MILNLTPKIKLFAKLLHNVLLTRNKVRIFYINIDGDWLICYKTIDHLFKFCDLACNILSTINTICISPINCNCSVINWIEHVWSFKTSYHKTFYNPFEKIFTIILAIWNHRNWVVFRNHESNHVSVLEKARYMFQYRRQVVQT